MSDLKEWVRRNVLPSKIGRHTIIRGPNKGSTIVTSWHDYPAAILGETELPLLHWFEEHVKHGETWLDVGGHYGYTAIALARLTGPSGRVFTFEPVVASAGCIAETRRLNRLSHINVLPMALGSPETIEQIGLPLTRGMADATLATDPNLDVEQVVVARFDWLWKQISTDPRVHGIKIDVQGMELRVLAGMTETLRKWRPILAVEVHEGVSRDEILALLRDAGYGPPIPIEPEIGETTAQLHDNKSYAFLPA